MKKIFVVLTVLLITVSLLTMKAQNAPSNNGVKSSDDEVALDVQRGSGDVKLALQIKDITQYHHIIIERSAESPNYFGKCKYISCASVKVTDGKIMEADRYPYSANKDVYYRIKTVTNDGIERAYPAVLLAAASQ